MASALERAREEARAFSLETADGRAIVARWAPEDGEPYAVLSSGEADDMCLSRSEVVCEFCDGREV